MMSSMTRRGVWAFAAFVLATCASPALAHVKWFSDFSYDDVPLTLTQVMSPTFLWLAGLSALAMGLLVVLDDRLQDLPGYRGIDQWLRNRSSQSGVILRAGMAAVLLLSWQADSLLAPELHLRAEWLGGVEFFAAMMLLFARTIPVGGALVLALYVDGVGTFGILHMLDYLHYAGGGYYLLVSQADPRWRASGLPALYSTVGFSLCWLGFEKLVYPKWGLYVLQQNPALSLGLDLEFFLTGSAFVEICLGYLLIICLLQRPIALLVTLVFFSTTMLFGKVEVIGHTQVHAALIVFLIEGPGSRYRAPYTFHRRMPLRVAFAVVNFVILLGLVGAGYGAAAAMEYSKQALQGESDRRPVIVSPQPSIDFRIVEEGQMGRVLELTTTNFRFSAGGVHEDGAGHAHLYVDGRQVGRLYGPLHDIARLPAGPHEINVTLNTNDHRPYGTGTGIVQRSKKIILSAGNNNDDG